MKTFRHLLCLLSVVFLVPCTAALAAEGDTIVVLNEDFSAFTEGSESSPTTTDISGYTGKLRTELTGWSGSRVYEAGGCLKIGDSGYLQTANTDMTSNGGNLRISFRAKALDATGGGIQLLLNSSYSVTTTVYLDNGEWTDVVVMVGGGTATGYLRIKPYLIASGMLIDDLKIETSQAFIGVPEATQPTVVSDEAFTATWKVVSGATSYLLDVYTKNGDVKEYLLKDESVDKPASSYATTQSKQVTGLQAGKKYFFTVRAKRDQYVSDYSNEIQVVKVISNIDAPVATDATDVSATGFTAHWNEVAIAEGYEVTLYRRQVLQNDSTVDVLYDDFGGFTNGTLNSPSYPSASALDNYTSQPGWTGLSVALAAASGYFGMSPYSGSGYICTPALDLSKNEGKYKVTMKAASYYYGTFKDDSVKIYFYDGGSAPADSATIYLSGDFSDYTVECSKGAAESYVYIEYAGTNKFYMDEFAVSQELKAGDVYTSRMETFPAGSATELKFDVPLSNTIGYAYTVAAYAPTVKGSSYTGYYVDNIYSSSSNEIIVSYSEPTGIGVITGEKSGDNVWYTLSGMRLNGEPTIKGIYIYNGKKVLVK